VRDYGKVHTTFWSSATIQGLSEDARVLALYLLTSPHGTIAGVFRLPDGYACEDLKWSPERVSEGFRELLANGFANRCETTKWVWVDKHFEWNKPENPNQRKSAAKVAQSIPDECTWKPDFMRAWAGFLGIEWAATSNPSETLSQPFANQEQEQKQKQEKRGAPDGAVSIPDVDPKVVADFLKIRKAKRAPLTETALAGIQREAAKAGVTLEQALRTCCERGWSGFKADWVGAQVAATKAQLPGGGRREL
jgi:hypothetical protein